MRHLGRSLAALLTAGVLLAIGWPGEGRALRSNARVPILMYHVVSSPRTDAAYPDLFVSEPRFRAQMRLLAAEGYDAVTLDEVFASWRGGRPLPARPIVVTFDDGYRSVHTNAFPILERLGWPAVLNLTVRNQHVSGGLSPWKVETLVAAGWELDSHSSTHPDLTGLDRASLEREVAGSRRALRRRYGEPVSFFCYPAGRYSDAVVSAVKAAGYLGAMTTRPGLARADEAYVLARVRVSGGDSAASLLAKLAALGA